MTALQMPQVHDCTADDCAFNVDAGCHAGAITIVGDHSHCGTFVTLDVAPFGDLTATVGACPRVDCTHNDKLACTADTVSVGSSYDAADCLTFAAR